jgi:flagellar motility protein MotE (MotC chaperone)
MPKLRNSIITQILDYLEHGDFCLEDFDVQFPDDSSVLAEITFKAFPKYSFTLDESYPGGAIGATLALSNPNNIQKVIRTVERPGEYKNNEHRTHNDINSAIYRVSDWVRNIREDLIHSKSTIRATIDELTENFQKSIDESIDNPSSYFEESEIDDIRQKLDELQARVSELESKFNISSEETIKIQKVINKSKSDLEIYPKGVWYKTAGTKIIKVMKEVLSTKEGREIISDIAKKLLS